MRSASARAVCSLQPYFECYSESLETLVDALDAFSNELKPLGLVSSGLGLLDKI